MPCASEIYSNGGFKQACAVFLFNHWKYISAATMLMVITLGRVVIYHESLPPINSHYSFITWSCGITRQTNLYICTTAMLIATKLQVVTYLEGLLPIKSHDPLITWSCKIMWKTKSFLYPLLKYLMAP